MEIRSFRGKLEDGGKDKISLATADGSIGYRILKFQIMMEQPGNTAQESVVKIFKVDPGTVPTSAATIDFGDNTLIGAAFQDTNVHPSDVVIFDRDIFNQDIFVTYTDNGSGTNEDINYYIELERMTLNLNENTVITLKDIRNTNSQ